MVGPAMDCLNNPLGAVRTLYEKACAQSSMRDSGSDWGVKELFEDYLFRQGGYQQVPEINSISLCAIPTNTLVRFRGMVQDMFDVEYYLGAYKDGTTWRTTKYTDVTDVPIHEYTETALWDRRLLYCVPVPGENPWVKQGFALPSERRALSSSRDTLRLTKHSEKRPRESSEDVEMDLKPDDSTESKRHRDEECSTSVGHPTPASDLTTLEESMLLSCIVKVYDGPDSDFKLNDVVEFIGILTFDPELSVGSFSRGSADTESSLESLDRTSCSQLPASRVPRLHCITFRKLSLHKILESFPTSERLTANVTGTPTALRDMRDSIMNALTNLLGGDRLAAEYFLLHLLSQVHHRVDGMAVGKLSLNIVLGNESSDLPCPLTAALGKIIESLLPCSHVMPLSLHTLNKNIMTPRKDYAANRLVTGFLQLADGTYLLLDETALSTGQLNSSGCQNIQSLKHLMEWQVVEYDFEYYKMEMPADIPILIISHARSRLLPADVVIPLRRIADIPSFLVNDEDLEQWRSFLSCMRNRTPSLDPSMQKFVEKELVDARQRDASLTPEAFHRWLTLAKLLSSSYGEIALSIERWRRVQEMEQLCAERSRCC